MSALASLGQLGGGVDPPPEAVAEPPERLLDSLDLDDINAHLESNHALSSTRRDCWLSAPSIASPPAWAYELKSTHGRRIHTRSDASGWLSIPWTKTHS